MLKIGLDDGVGQFHLKSSLSDFSMFKRTVKVFSSALLEDAFHLTDRELELLFCIVSFYKFGDGDIFSKGNVNKFFKPFGSKRLIQVWLPKLANKHWVDFNSKSVVIKQDKVLKFLLMDTVMFDIKFTRE